MVGTSRCPPVNPGLRTPAQGKDPPEKGRHQLPPPPPPATRQNGQGLATCVQLRKRTWGPGSSLRHPFGLFQNQTPGFWFGFNFPQLFPLFLLLLKLLNGFSTAAPNRYTFPFLGLKVSLAMTQATLPATFLHPATTH